MQVLTSATNHVYACVRIARERINLRKGAEYARALGANRNDVLLDLAAFLEQAAVAVDAVDAVSFPAWLSEHADAQSCKLYVITHAVLPVALHAAGSVDGAVVAFHDACTLKPFALLLDPCMPALYRAAPRITQHRARSALCCSMVHLADHNPELVRNSQEHIAQMLLELMNHTKAMQATLSALQEVGAVRTKTFDRIGMERCVRALRDVHSEPNRVTRTVRMTRARYTELLSMLFARYAATSAYRCVRVRTRVLPVIVAIGVPEECFSVLVQLVTGSAHLLPFTAAAREIIASAPHQTDRWTSLRAKLAPPAPCVPPERLPCSASGVDVQDAVVASDGHTYDRAVLETLLSMPIPLSPATREPLLPWCAPNHALRG